MAKRADNLVADHQRTPPPSCAKNTADGVDGETMTFKVSFHRAGARKPSVVAFLLLDQLPAYAPCLHQMQRSTALSKSLTRARAAAIGWPSLAMSTLYEDPSGLGLV
jgi:hypothetical protein